MGGAAHGGEEGDGGQGEVVLPAARRARHEEAPDGCHEGGEVGLDVLFLHLEELVAALHHLRLHCIPACMPPWF